MKTYSNNPIPNVLKWKGEQLFVAVNHKENPVLTEEDEGKRYECEFTVVEKNTADAAIHAFTRMQEDEELDNAVIFNFEIEGKKAIEIKKEYKNKVSTSIFKPLPEAGFLKKGEIYSYGNGAVMVVQDHERTIYTPEQTPALFSFHRETTEGQEWIPQEEIQLNSTRTYQGQTYKCIQAHTSQEGWEPDKTPALWQLVEEQPEIPEWVQPTGGHDAYNTGDRVLFEGKTYESLIDANVWSPTSYPQGWKEI